MKRNFAVISNLSPQSETEPSNILDTPITNPTQVGNPTQVQTQTLVETERPSTSRRRVTEQDSSVVLESTFCEGLERGYTRIPNGVLMKLVGGNFTRNEIKIALIIARFTISFRREYAPLSKKVLERQSGLRGAAVLEAISGLVAKGLAQKQQGDQYRPNMLGLVLPQGWESCASTGREEPSKLEITEVTNSTQVEVESYPPVEIATQGEVGKATPFKDIKIYKNNNSLAELPDSLQIYFSNLKPAKKRESEFRAFENLSRDYETQDIAACFELLKTQGVQHGKRSVSQPCHSPMAYLAKAINEVLEQAKRSQKTKLQNAKDALLIEEQKTQQSELRSEEEREFAEMEGAFNSAFPSEEAQKEFIEKSCKDMPFPSSPRIRKVFAINAWWSTSRIEAVPIQTQS